MREPLSPPPGPGRVNNARYGRRPPLGGCPGDGGAVWSSQLESKALCLLSKFRLVVTSYIDPRRAELLHAPGPSSEVSNS